jgi:hypothetical protein
MQLLEKLQHPGWVGVVLPFALAIGSTFTPGTVRVLLLLGAIAAATWVFYNTKLGAKSIGRTSVSFFVFLLVAGVVFFEGRRFDASQVSPTQVTVTKVPEQQPATQSQQQPTRQPIVDSQPLITTPKKKPVKPAPEPSAALPPAATQSQPSFSVTNPNGSIVNQDSTVSGTQTVNNFGEAQYPLKGIIPNLVVCMPPSMALSNSKGSFAAMLAPANATYQTTIRVTTDASITRPGFFLQFDVPVEDSATIMENGGFTEGGSVGRDPRASEPEKSIGLRVNSVGSNSEKTWFPGNALSMTVYSQAPLHLLLLISRPSIFLDAEL